MDVHHHSHSARKKWTHYFWEFFMLFLAVSAGFLVENWRHHRLEKSYERQYMYSLVEDYTAILTKVADAEQMGYPYKELRKDTARVYKWISNDPRDLQTLYNYTVNFQWVSSIYTIQLKGLKQQAEELINFLKKEYHLK